MVTSRDVWLDESCSCLLPMMAMINIPLSREMSKNIHQDSCPGDFRPSALEMTMMMGEWQSPFYKQTNTEAGIPVWTLQGHLTPYSWLQTTQFHAMYN